MNLQSFLKRNSSTILTCIGAVGVVATSVMAVKATPKALTRIEEAKEEKGEELTKLELVNVAGPVYIPTIVTGAATLACIFGANILNKRQQAAITSAYALLNQSYKEYRSKVDELYGEDAGVNVRNEIAKDKYREAPIMHNEDLELFYDFFSGRHFTSTMEKVQWAQYETNRRMALDGGVYLNDYYELVGVGALPEYDSFGWSAGHMGDAHWHPWIEFEHETIPMEDEDEYENGLMCTVIYTPYEPFPDFIDY